jgi:hypothetical protein
MKFEVGDYVKLSDLASDTLRDHWGDRRYDVIIRITGSNVFLKNVRGIPFFNDEDIGWWERYLTHLNGLELAVMKAKKL